MRRLLVLVMVVSAVSASRGRAGQEGSPAPQAMDSPTIKVLKGLTVPEFDAEMKGFVAALGVNCGYCHVRGNYASDANEHKLVARRMIEMTKLIDQQFFPDYKPGYDESRLGQVTCFTCHQGELRPKTTTP